VIYIDAVKARVERVIEKGRYGPYAIAKASSSEIRKLLRSTITFSLDPKIWTEKSFPEGGDFVFLDKLIGSAAGWRSEFGRFWKPSDEKSIAAPRQLPKEGKQPTKSARK
jgi:hypothetical protein